MKEHRTGCKRAAGHIGCSPSVVGWGGGVPSRLSENAGWYFRVYVPEGGGDSEPRTLLYRDPLAGWLEPLQYVATATNSNHPEASKK